MEKERGREGKRKREGGRREGGKEGGKEGGRERERERKGERYMVTIIIYSIVMYMYYNTQRFKRAEAAVQGTHILFVLLHL